MRGSMIDRVPRARGNFRRPRSRGAWPTPREEPRVPAGVNSITANEATIKRTARADDMHSGACSHGGLTRRRTATTRDPGDPET